MKNIKLNKTQLKIIAKDALREGRVMDAVMILTQRYSLESALVEIAPTPTAKVGDILYTSWGYEQTNVDFYQVVRVSGKAVYVREVGKNYHPSKRTRGAEYVSAVRGAFIGEEKRHTIAKHYTGIGYTIAIKSYATAWLWDGEPKFETAAGYGH